MPLRIFEPRYREMLREVLRTHRMFGVVNLDPENTHHLAEEEPPFAYATAGIVHSCHGNKDGTSELLLHGLARVRIERIVRESPYRVVAVSPVASEPGAPEPELLMQRTELLHKLDTRASLGCRYPEELSSFLVQSADHDALADLVSHLFCGCPMTRQELLETLSTHERLLRLNRYFCEEIAQLRLRRTLQGKLDDDNVGCN